jgi:serine protease Do
MMKKCRLVSLFLSLLSAAWLHAADSTLVQLSASFEGLAEKVSPAVVQIFNVGLASAPDRESGSLYTSQLSSGSGVIVAPEGYIITNAHVIQFARRVQVLVATPLNNAPRKSILKSKGKFLPADLVGLDSETDLAVLKVKEEGELPYLELGDSDALKPGQLVFAFGSPLGLENSVSMGVISAVARQLRAEDPMIYLQTDTPINPGNSGGPLVDINGKVIGINTLIYSQSGGNEGIGFAAPSNIVRNVYRQLRESGRVHRGEIGLRAQTITPTMAEGLSLPKDWGAIVGDVYPEGPADRAGVKIGDIILTLDGKVIENGRQFDVNLYRRNLGDKVTIEVLRNKEKMAFDVIVTSKTEDLDRISDVVRTGDNVINRLGILCVAVTDSIAQRLPGLRKQYGVMVAARIAGAPYWANEFKPGDIIHAVNGQYITGIDQLRGIVRDMKNGAAIVLQIERSGQLLFLPIELD